MRRIGFWGMVAFVAFVAAAIVLAARMGETSHAYARGAVVLPDNLVEQARGVRTLFVIALGPDRPMPLGAMRHALSDDPSGTVYEFVMTPESMAAMGGGVEWPETFRLKARLDKDFTRADEIRKALEAEHVMLEDTSDGTLWRAL